MIRRKSLKSMPFEAKKICMKVLYEEWKYQWKLCIWQEKSSNYIQAQKWFVWCCCKWFPTQISHEKIIAVFELYCFANSTIDTKQQGRGVPDDSMIQYASFWAENWIGVPQIMLLLCCMDWSQDRCCYCAYNMTFGLISQFRFPTDFF